MSFPLKVIPAVLPLLLAASLLGQAPAGTPPAAVSASAILRPALTDVQSATAELRISKWKLPGDFRKAAEQDVESIQSDLGSTLPGLLAKADAAPGSVPPSFAVYRNVDALYDVMLRVSQMADLGAPSQEAVAIASALRNLEAARRQLGDSILNAAQRHATRLATLEAAIKAANSAPPKETIINDGPANSHSKHRTTRKKASPK